MAQENKDLRFRILASIVGGDVINKFGSDIEKTSQASSKMTSQLGSLSNGLKALAGAWVTTEAVHFAKNIINVADELDELSEKTGIAVEDLSSFHGLAQVEGVALEELTANFKKLSSSIVEAATGSKDYRAAFKTLGIEIKDGAGNLRNTGDILREISDKFAKMENGAGKSAIAVKLFGKSGSEFIPFLNKGSDELERFSLAIDADFASRAGKFNDTLAELSISTKNFVLSGVKEIIPTLQEIADAMKSSPNDSGVAKILFQDLGEIFRWTAAGANILLAGFIDLSDFAGTVLKQTAFVLKDAWDGVATGVYDTGRVIYEAVKGNFSGAQEIIQEMVSKGKKGFTDTLHEQDKIFGDFLDRYMARSKSAGDFNEKVLKNSIFVGDGTEGAKKDTAPETSTAQRAIVDITELSKARTVERDRVKEFIEQQELENRQRRLALGDINLTTLELRKTTESRKLDAEAIRQGKTMTEEQRKALMAATEEIKKQREEIIQHEYDLKRTYVYGAREYLRDYLDNVTNNANSIKQVFQAAFSSLEDTMVTFVKTGKMNFRNFADAVINELIRISVRQAVLAPIAGALSSAFAASAGGTATTSGSVNSGAYSSAASSGQYQFANGGIMTSHGELPLHKYASGGIANSPQMALFGEGRMPEAYVPLPDGRSIPVKMTGGEGGINVNMTVNIQSNSQDASVESNKQAGAAMGKLIQNTVISTIIEQKRPGGLLSA